MALVVGSAEDKHRTVHVERVKWPEDQGILGSGLR